MNISDIKLNLANPLPGKTSHIKLAPYTARLEAVIPKDVFEAAVLILLYKKEDKIYFPLITRQSHNPNDVHRGQIALPGGRKDLEDEGTHITSIRECSEEIGVQKEHIEILGSLTPVYIPISHHHVFPYVGFYQGSLEFTLQANEILDIHEIELNELLEINNRKLKELWTSEGKLKEVPTIELHQLIIWGATAMILEEFSDVIKNIVAGEI
jgi:8-oxo-dGTP pyrophosphatase MutT (NUDIX family)